MPTVKLTGSSGSTYKCEVYPMCMFGSFSGLAEVKAVYMFARVERDARTGKRKSVAIYVGETEDVNDRLDEDHHQIDCIREKGATHIFIYRDEEDTSLKKKKGRLKIEDDLKKRYHPECQR